MSITHSLNYHVLGESCKIVAFSIVGLECDFIGIVQFPSALRNIKIMLANGRMIPVQRSEKVEESAQESEVTA